VINWPSTVASIVNLTNDSPVYRAHRQPLSNKVDNTLRRSNCRGKIKLRVSGKVPEKSTLIFGDNRVKLVERSLDDTLEVDRKPVRNAPERTHARTYAQTETGNPKT